MNILKKILESNLRYGSFYFRAPYVVGFRGMTQFIAEKKGILVALVIGQETLRKPLSVSIRFLMDFVCQIRIFSCYLLSAYKYFPEAMHECEKGEFHWTPQVL